MTCGKDLHRWGWGEPISRLPGPLPAFSRNTRGRRIAEAEVHRLSEDRRPLPVPRQPPKPRQSRRTPAADVSGFAKLSLGDVPSLSFLGEHWPDHLLLRLHAIPPGPIPGDLLPAFSPPQPPRRRIPASRRSAQPAGSSATRRCTERCIGRPVCVEICRACTGLASALRDVGAPHCTVARPM